MAVRLMNPTVVSLILSICAAAPSLGDVRQRICLMGDWEFAFVSPDEKPTDVAPSEGWVPIKLRDKRLYETS